MAVVAEDPRLRYSRQIALSEIGIEGQKKLLESKVMIIGCGALGSMVAMQLAGAGVGELGIADFDNIDISNLQRQFFFRTDESGQSKVGALTMRIKELNPDVKINSYSELITLKKAEELFKIYDFVVDATDNPESKRMTGNTSKQTGKGCCIGGVSNFEGMVITFRPGDPRFEEYFGNGETGGFLPCSLGGVFGPAAAFCASLQASETIKYIINAGSLLSGCLFHFNLLTNTFREFSL